MTTTRDLERRCGILAQALKQGQVDKSVRKAVRELLLKVFHAVNSESPDDEELTKLSPLVNNLLDTLGLESSNHDTSSPSIADDLLKRHQKIYPVKMKSAIRNDLLNQHAATWTQMANRLDDVVDWFWDRCRPEEEAALDTSVQAKAAEEFGSDEMEYVWGRRKR